MFLSLQNRVVPKAFKIATPVNSISCILNNNANSKFIVLNTSLRSKVILNQPLRNYATAKIEDDKKQIQNPKKKIK